MSKIWGTCHFENHKDANVRTDLIEWVVIASEQYAVDITDTILAGLQDADAEVQYCVLKAHMQYQGENPKITQRIMELLPALALNRNLVDDKEYVRFKSLGVLFQIDREKAQKIYDEIQSDPNETQKFKDMLKEDMSRFFDEEK